MRHWLFVTIRKNGKPFGMFGRILPGIVVRLEKNRFVRLQREDRVFNQSLIAQMGSYSPKE